MLDVYRNIITINNICIFTYLIFLIQFANHDYFRKLKRKTQQTDRQYLLFELATQLFLNQLVI